MGLDYVYVCFGGVVNVYDVGSIVMLGLLFYWVLFEVWCVMMLVDVGWFLGGRWGYLLCGVVWDVYGIGDWWDDLCFVWMLDYGFWYWFWRSGGLFGEWGGEFFVGWCYLRLC